MMIPYYDTVLLHMVYCTVLYPVPVLLYSCIEGMIDTVCICICVPGTVVLPG